MAARAWRTFDEVAREVANAGAPLPTDPPAPKDGRPTKIEVEFEREVELRHETAQADLQNSLNFITIFNPPIS